MVGNGAPQPGDVLGNYVLKRLLGTGGMGLVYLAEHERLRRKVALKLLRPELTQDPVSVRRFFAEARAVNEIGHDNIVEVTDFVDQGEHRYFVMELLKGHALGDVMQQGRLTLPRVIHVARQVADALAAAHEAGVVHRDLKPQNVFLIKRGMDADFVKVLDFGIAKVRGMEGDVEQTAAGTFVGTPAYMAPEQLANKPCDHRVDVYSFGVMFFELVTGVRPFRATNMAEIIVQQLTTPPPKPSVVFKENGGAGVLPDKLERFLLALLEKNPDKRVQSMRDALNVIEEIVPLVAGSSAGMGSIPQRLVDTTGDYALPSAAGWVAVNKDNAALTTGEGFAPDEPDFANLDDVVEATPEASAEAAKPVVSNASPSAAPRTAAPISFAPLPPLPAFAPLPPLPPLGRSPAPFGAPVGAPAGAFSSSPASSSPASSSQPSKLDDSSAPILIGRPITQSGPLPGSHGSHGADNGNGASGTKDTAGSESTNGHADDMGPLALEGVVPAIVPRAETSPTMAHVDANLSPELLSSASAAEAPARSKRGLAIAAVATVVVAVIVVALLRGDDGELVAATPTPVDSLPSNPRPTDAPPTDAQPTDAQPTDAQPTDAQPTDAQPTDAQPTDAQPTDAQPTDKGRETAPITVTADDLNEPTGRQVRTNVEVSFTSSPEGATVVMGGKTLGTTPLRLKVAESSRAVSVSFNLKGYEPKTVSAAMAAGATVNAALVEVKKTPKTSVKDGALINPFKKKPK